MIPRDKFVLWYLKNLPFPSSSYTHLENIRVRGPNLQVLGCSFSISPDLQGFVGWQGYNINSNVWLAMTVLEKPLISYIKDRRQTKSFLLNF